jgi:hypothetical protein
MYQLPWAQALQVVHVETFGFAAFVAGTNAELRTSSVEYVSPSPRGSVSSPDPLAAIFQTPNPTS